MTVRFSHSLYFCFPLIFLISCRVGSEKENGALNRLAKASSPYLRAHADNPVDWYEWSAEALDKAKKENKPLLISIGYSSCHWCHVMERESFMDTAVARIMNENFVSIKIDREQRPDLDQIYLDAAQLISGNGGWPLNAFTLPNGKPFYAGTYYPKDQWISLLQQVIDTYKNKHDDVIKQAEALTRGIQENQIISLPEDSLYAYNKKTYQEIFTNYESAFDFAAGGLKGDLKFPMPVIWEALLQNHHLTGNEKALEMVNTSLYKMASGGIYDQVGGGFSRYSTDVFWRVPHFEKMLYDNGQLVSLYAHAYQVTRDTLYARVVEETLNFIGKEMTSPEGGFYSSLNADSEGEEGKFYVWTKPEIAKILDAESADLIMQYYAVTDSGNWEGGKNILYTHFTEEEFAIQKRISLPDFRLVLENAKAKLLHARDERVRPSRDEKILTSWNALMMNGYIAAYFALGNPDYLQIALANARFLEKNMMGDDGHLWRNYHEGQSGIEAFLDDYALLAKAFIDLYEATFDIHWLEKARSLTSYALNHFQDTETGLFYYNANESQTLVVRKMELYDNVIPSSNAVLAEVLFLLGRYYDVPAYVERSTLMLNRVSIAVTTAGPHYANWANLMGLVTYQPYEVAIIGADALKKSRAMLRHYLPTALFMGGDKVNLPLLENKLVANRTIIYVCRNKICKMPEEDVDRAMKQFN